MRRFFVVMSLLSLLPASVFAQTGINGSSASAPPAAPMEVVWRSDHLLNDAEALMREKKFVDALDILDRVLMRNVRNADAYVDTAIVWINLGNFEKAQNAVDNAFLVDKNHLGAYVASALIALKQKNLPQAQGFLSALRVLCHGDQCAEYQFLQRAVREASIVK